MFGKRIKLKTRTLNERKGRSESQQSQLCRFEIHPVISSIVLNEINPRKCSGKYRKILPTKLTNLLPK